MKNLIIAIILLVSLSSASAQTLPQVIDMSNLPSNAVIIKDSITTFDINEGQGVGVVHHPTIKVYPKDFNQKVEISYSRMYSYVWDDTITIQHVIWKCDPNYPFTNNESTLPQTIPGSPNAVIWKEDLSFFPHGDNGGGASFEVINTKTYKLYDRNMETK